MWLLSYIIDIIELNYRENCMLHQIYTHYNIRLTLITNY